MNIATLRQANATDATVIAQMLACLADDLGDGDVFSSTSATILKHGFGDVPMFHVVLAETEGRAIGFALYFAHYSTTKGGPGVYVQDLWIDPSARRDGLGHRLLAAVAAHAKKTWTAAFMKLSVHSDNPDAERFYRRLGFTAATNETAMIANIDAYDALRGEA